MTRLFEQLFVVGTLLFMSNALFRLIEPEFHIGDTAFAEQGFEVYQSIGAVIYALTFVLVLKRRKEFTRICLENKLLLMMVGYAVLSTVWSVHPEVTLRRSLALAGTTAFALYVATRFTSAEFFSLVATALGIAALLTVVFVFISPEIAIHARDGRDGSWRGMFGWKDEMGLSMALGVLAFVSMLRSSSGRSRRIAAVGLILCASCLVMSRSVTAGTVTALLLPFALIPRSLRGMTWLAWIQVVIVGCISIYVATMPFVDFARDTLGLFGRDLTLSNRTYLWSAAIDLGLEQPLFGFGYRAFWLGNLRMLVQESAGWSATHGHSGYLDLWLELGALGVLLFLLGLIVWLRRLVRCLSSHSDREAIYFPVFVLYMLLASVSYTEILTQNRVPWVLYVATLAYLSPSTIARSIRRDLGNRRRKVSAQLMDGRRTALDPS